MMMHFAFALAASTTPSVDAIDEREGCRRASLLCLDADGLPLEGDTLPASITAGTGLDVKVIGCRTQHEGAAFRVVDESRVADERHFRSTPRPTATLAPRGPCTPEVLERVRIAVPSDVLTRTFTVGFSRESAADRNGVRTIERQESFSTSIQHGRYYLDIGVLFPVIVAGERRVVGDAGDTPGTTVLRVRQDLDVFPALMLHVFPGGRDIGVIGSFTTGHDCRTAREPDSAAKEPVRLAQPNPSDCHTARHRRRAANSLGLQFGLALDMRPVERLFFGGLFEPVSGVSIGAGLALTRVERLRPGVTEGDVVPTPPTTDADGEVDLGHYVDRAWAPRLYLGVTLSFDIIRTITERRRSGSAASDPKK